MEGKEEMELDSETEMANSQLKTATETFKKPQLCLVGPRKSKGAKVRVVDSQPESKSIEKEEDSVEAPHVDSPVIEISEEPLEVDNKCNKLSSEPEHRTSKQRKGAPAQKLKETPIPYLEPKWGAIPTDHYSLDVIKSGTVLEPLDLSTKSHIVFGRQTNCDVQMAHPTVSRHHAVLQYSRGTDDKPQGFYLYDLGSTHGTFLNKSRVRPEIFIRIKVGHQIKLGGSSRLYLLQGPSDDMEEESELTVTELKAKRQLELQARELAEISRKQKEEEEEKKREEEGVDWGMGDDADEETDLSENPYAATTNEELYIDDPKKTLRGWFEREGHELEYDVEEKGQGQFLCRIEVPVEGARGGRMVAEAFVKGKKKEAVAQCALEACRLLDRLGLLRQATHESRKRKAKNWEDEDFYDSDDDIFLDRTGVVEKKRQQRMKQAGKAEDQVETYQSLTEKHSDIVKKLKSTQAQLQRAQADLADAKKKAADDEEGDTLDSFMSNLSNVGCTDKKLVSKLKVELAALHKDEAQLRKLVNIARPASLPELVAPVTASNSLETKDANTLKNKLMLAARKKASEKQKIVAGPSLSQDSKCEDLDSEEEEEKEAAETSTSKKEAQVNQSIENPYKEKEMPTNQTSKPKSTSDHTVTIGPPKPAFINDPSDPTKPDEGTKTTPVSEESEERIPSKESNIAGNDDNDDDTDEISLKEAEKRKKRNRRRLQQRNEKALERTKTEYDTSDPNYSVWVPPQDQSGDGKTKLNEKLGY